MKNFGLSLIAVAVVVGAGAFYGGMQYAQSKSPRGPGQEFQDLRNLAPEERRERLQQLGGQGFRGGRFGGAGGDFTLGEIIAKDEQRITVKLSNPRLPDGQARQPGGQAPETASAAGSKIIFYSAATEIGKFTSGAPSDLEVGKTVTVSGTANTDGSITAQSIQIRPAGASVLSPTAMPEER